MQGDGQRLHLGSVAAIVGAPRARVQAFGTQVPLSVCDVVFHYLNVTAAIQRLNLHLVKIVGVWLETRAREPMTARSTAQVAAPATARTCSLLPAPSPAGLCHRGDSQRRAARELGACASCCLPRSGLRSHTASSAAEASEECRPAPTRHQTPARPGGCGEGPGPPCAESSLVGAQGADGPPHTRGHFSQGASQEQRGKTQASQPRLSLRDRHSPPQPPIPTSICGLLMSWEKTPSSERWGLLGRGQRGLGPPPSEAR